ncbi:hypothetical protein [Streptomyces luteogriseus]
MALRPDRGTITAGSTEGTTRSWDVAASLNPGDHRADLPRQ